MRNLIIIVMPVVLLLSSVSAGADDSYNYRIGPGYGLSSLKAGDKPYYSFNHAWGIAAGIEGDLFSLTFSLLSQKNYNDSDATGHFGFFSSKEKAGLVFKSLRAGFDLDYRLTPKGTLRPTVGVGVGYLIWKFADPVGDTVIQTDDDRGSTVNFSASEMYVSGSVGMEIAASERLAVNWKISVDYLTGLGSSFSDEVDDSRGRMLMRSGIFLLYRFGGKTKRHSSTEPWPSTEAWSQQKERGRLAPSKGDSDGDGVGDKHDKCPGTPRGVMVDKTGCAFDSDNDGVADGLDDCPRTPRSATGYVDMFGCPVDADYDGIPDYRDTCRMSPAGTVVDEYGCPLDADGDGIYDGRDDCPHTAPGIEVDRRGCIDIAFLNDTMIIRIEYQSGSFEVDMRTRDRLQPLIRKLQVLSDVHVTILGYTDNVGPTEANQSLSQKRANRLRDWLVIQGIDEQRMTPIGKGETNFIASNETASGRTQNRRIELVFNR
jgi:outer membrane protein OmpA-like peptidoglycan-associated protein